MYGTSCLRGIVIRLVSAGAAGLFASPAAAIPPATPADWEALDIVPMPKQVLRRGTELALGGSASPVLALGSAATEQDRLGAEYINRRITALGGSALDIMDAEHAPDGRAVIHIGTPESHPGVAAAVGAGLADVGAGNPGERGYEIRVPDDYTVWLAGADPIGALYACVTFSELFRREKDGTLVWPRTEVRDWPDFLAVTAGQSAGIDNLDISINTVIRSPTPETRERYLEAMRKQVDFMLRRKMSLLRVSATHPRRWRNDLWTGPPEMRAMLREGLDLARAHGVGALFYAAAPFVGLREDLPEAPYDCVDARSSRYGQWVRCWSMDDERRAYARELARKVHEIGISDFGFHDTDTGGYLNPAGWNGRCARCRERWGDDYAAASAQKALIFAEAFREEAPGTRMHYTFYPYHCRTVDDQGCLWVMERLFGRGPHSEALAREMVARYTDFWSRLNATLPEDNTTFVLREDTPESVTRFRDLTPGRDILWWEGGLWQHWAPFVHRGPSWWQTYHRPGRRDVLYINYTGPAGVPVMPLLHYEYSWNVNAPGSEPFARDQEGAERWRHGEPEGALFTVVLPHVVRNLYGRELAPDLVEALSRNVSLDPLIQALRTPHHILRAPGTAMLDWQAERAGAAAAAMNRAWHRLTVSGDWLGLDEEALTQLSYLREALHFAWYIGRIRAAESRARDRARAADLAGARDALATAAQALAEGEARMAALVEERPPPLQAALRLPRTGRVRGIQLQMGEYFVRDEAGYWRGILEATAGQLETMARLAGVPGEVVAELSAGRLARALRVAEPPVRDGSLGAEAWSDAHPVESFFLIQEEEAHIASAFTRARLLHDEEYLYLGILCRPVPGTTVQAGDTVEIFLRPPALGGDYIQLFVRADGGLRQQRMYRADMEIESEVEKWERDTTWERTGITARTRMEETVWTAEVAVPFAALDAAPAGRWNINLARACPDGSGRHELSSILPPGARSFHEPDRFPDLVWTRDAYRPEVLIDIRAPERSVRTFADAIATVASFGLRVDSSLVLNGVHLHAEAYDAAGVLRRRIEIPAADPLLYAWEAEDMEIRYDEEIDRGGIRVVLEAADGAGEAWYRFGGWEGAGEHGAIFSGPKKK